MLIISVFGFFLVSIFRSRIFYDCRSPAFSNLSLLSSIFLFLLFPPLLFCRSFSFSVIFHPCFFVHHFPFLHFPPPYICLSGLIFFCIFSRPMIFCAFIANVRILPMCVC